LITVTWRLPSFIVSLGMLEVARGSAYLVTDSRTQYIGSAIEWLSAPLGLGLSPAFALAVAIVIASHIVLRRSVFGRYLVGVGTNEEAMRLAGVDPRPLKVLVFILMGTLAALAGLMQISRLEAADPNAGVGMELQVIAAVVIGGTRMMGGRVGPQHVLWCVDRCGAGSRSCASGRFRSGQARDHGLAIMWLCC
jgi:ribose transport system permease protein